MSDSAAAEMKGGLFTKLKLLGTYGPTLASTVVSHYVLGPPQKGWPLQTSVFTAMMQQASSTAPPPDFSKPVDIAKHIKAVRKKANLEEWTGEPVNGFVAPVSIPARKEGLKGPLGDRLQTVGDTEDRVIKAEWVVHNSVYGARAAASSRVILYFHGGAYTVMSPGTHRPITTRISKAANSRVLSVDYRLAPENPFPSGLEDAVSAYLYLVEELKIPSGNIFISGDSAGGGLSLALLLYLRDYQLPRPGGAVLLSPWCDSTSSLRSWETNTPYDYLRLDPDDRLHSMTLYLGENPDNLLHPYVCSSLADFTSIPPLLVHTGGAELLLDENTLLAWRAKAAGVQVTHEIFEGGIHVPQFFVGTEMAREAFRAISRWLQKQEQPAPADFTAIDKVIDATYETKTEEWKAKAKADGEVVEPASLWVFEAVSKPAPKLVLRETTFNEAIRKGVEEIQVEGRDPPLLSTFYVPVKAPGWKGIRGTLHL